MRERITVNGKDYWLSVRLTKLSTSFDGVETLHIYIKIFKNKYSFKSITKTIRFYYPNSCNSTVEDNLKEIDALVDSFVDNFFGMKFGFDSKAYRYAGKFRNK